MGSEMCIRDSRISHQLHVLINGWAVISFFILAPYILGGNEIVSAWSLLCAPIALLFFSRISIGAARYYAKKIMSPDNDGTKIDSFMESAMSIAVFRSAAIYLLTTYLLALIIAACSEGLTRPLV